MSEPKAVDDVAQIKNLGVIAEEIKMAGGKDSILEHLKALGEDPRKEVDAFEGHLDLPVGKSYTKFAFEDESGQLDFKKLEGTAFVVDIVSAVAVLLQSVAHNFFYLKRSSRGTIMKEPVECIFLHQQLGGGGYHLKFHVIEFYPMPSYKTNQTQTITDGSDFCLALAIVDTKDPNYSPEKMLKIKPIAMAEFPFKPLEEFTGLRFGYPFEIYDPETQTMVPNHRGAPYASSGPMHYELRCDGDSGVLLYKAIDVFATEGDSGSLVVVEKDN